MRPRDSCGPKQADNTWMWKIEPTVEQKEHDQDKGGQQQKRLLHRQTPSKPAKSSNVFDDIHIELQFQLQDPERRSQWPTDKSTRCPLHPRNKYYEQYDHITRDNVTEP